MKRETISPSSRRARALSILGAALAVLAAAPASAAISSYGASSDTSNLIPALAYTGSYDFLRVYIDTVDKRTVGFAIAGIRANFLVENGQLHRYTGDGSSWSWAPVGTVGFTNANGNARWTVSRSAIGETEASNVSELVFQVETPLETTARYAFNYGHQQLAIPSYFGPGSKWSQLQNAAPTVGLAIINPSNGPGADYNAAYYNTVHDAQDHGVTVLGYVFSGYGARAAAVVKQDIDSYRNWYAVDGIFIDEASNDCGKQAYYQDLHDYIKGPGGKVVINPGTITPECYISTADIILNFEDVYSNYPGWRPMGWEAKYPADRFWHLIYKTSQADMPKAVSLSKSRRAGWVYVTPDKLPNPWDSLPTGSYWTDELHRVSH